MADREKVVFYGNTDTGKRRTNNEDAFVVEWLDDNSVLAIVIDGVGGYEGGEVAAEIAQREIPSYLREFNRGERLELLKQAVVCANNTIYDRRQFDKARPNMSCVLTSALVDISRNVIDMVHVGDTRLYQFHNGELSKLSHDHSFVGYCEEIGDLTEEEAMHHPRRNEISRSVGEERHGVNDQGFLEAVEFPLLPNTTFLLCSDGLTDLVTSAQISDILGKDISLEDKTKELINAANEAGGKDNVTVVLVAYHAEDANQSNEEDNSEISVSEEDNTRESGDIDSVKKCRRDTIIGVIAFGVIVLLLPCYVFLCQLLEKDTFGGTVGSEGVMSQETIQWDSIEEKEFTFMYDVDSDHPWSSYLSADSDYVLRLEKLYEDSLGCSYRALIFEPEYWRNGSTNYPALGEEPTYVGYGTDYYDGCRNQYLISFIRSDFGRTGNAYDLVLSGYMSNWDSVLTSNPIPAPWLSDEDDYEITFKKWDWEDIRELWNLKQARYFEK